MATYTAADAGCYFDSARGVHLGDAVINFAVDHGYKNAGDVDCEHEWYHEVWDEAEAYMNDNYPVDGHYWGTADHSGDWGLWAIGEDN